MHTRFASSPQGHEDFHDIQASSFRSWNRTAQQVRSSKFPPPSNITSLLFLPSYQEVVLTQPRIPEVFVTTIGSKSTHKAHICSNAKDTTFNDTKSSDHSDSWDTQGIYQKKEFEMTTMDGWEG
jgi:hypothetical protein